MIQKTFSKKPIVIADYREKEIVEILKKEKEINLLVKNLEIGDFIVGDYIIERKSFSDFLSSIIDKRLFRQIFESNKTILIIEGPFYFSRNLSMNAYYGALASILLSQNVKMIFSFNKEETAKIIVWLAKKYVTKNRKEIYKFAVPKKSSKSNKELVIQILSSFPGVSIKTAEKILKEFKNIYNFVTAKPYKLYKVLGEKKAKKIIKLIRE